MRLLRRLGLYEWVAFVTGFVLMAYELAASRVLAPSIGSSIYVWTSVIGVMIGALAGGYAVGGWLADRRGTKTDLAWLLVFAALAIIASCLAQKPMLDLASWLFSDARLQGVAATLLLFAPASFLLGMISPYLARLRIQSLSTTGRSVAGLSACNSIGGIVGTFCTGFIFFGIIGSQETLVLLSVTLLITSWIVSPGFKDKGRTRASIAVFLTVLIQASSTTPGQALAVIDTPTSNYTIMESRYGDKQVRVLTMGPGGWQSGIEPSNPNELVFMYIQQLATIVEASPAKNQVLILGGGAFTLPEYLGRAYPLSQITVVEIDPELPSIARQYFDYQDLPNVRIVAEDARAFLRTNTTDFDVIITDVYSDTAVPFTLTTQEYTALVKQSLAPDGVNAVNIIAALSQPCLPYLTGVNTSYSTVFASSHFFPLGNKLEDIQNFIAVYGNGDMEWVADLPGSISLPLEDGQQLTDNFAPIERLHNACHTRQRF